MQQFGKRFIFCALMIGAPALAVGGMPELSGGYRGALPADWFDGRPCRTGPITHVVDGELEEWHVDVSAVADDGNPDTFARCVALTNDAETSCLVGLEDGTVVACRDTTAPHVIPSRGDILYLALDSTNEENCHVYVGTHARFGEADPKCRPNAPPNTGGTTNTGGSSSGGASTGGSTSTGGTATGGGDPGGDGDAPFDCSAENTRPLSEVVLGASRPRLRRILRRSRLDGAAVLREGSCYSTSTTSGALEFTAVRNEVLVFAEDSTGQTLSALVPRRGQATITGLASGQVLVAIKKDRGRRALLKVESE